MKTLEQIKLNECESFMDYFYSEFTNKIASSQEKIISEALSVLGHKLTKEIVINNIEKVITQNEDAQFYYVENGNRTWLCTIYRNEPIYIENNQHLNTTNAVYNQKYTSIKPTELKPLEKIVIEKPKTKNMPHEIKLPKKCPHCKAMVTDEDLKIGLCYECNERI